MEKVYVYKSGTVELPLSSDVLPLFHGALLELTSSEHPDVHMFGRLEKIVINQNRRNGEDMRLVFEWTAELDANGRWQRGIDDVIYFDDYTRVFFVAVDRLGNPDRLLLYLPRGKQAYVLDRNRRTPHFLVRLERLARQNKAVRPKKGIRPTRGPRKIKAKKALK